nr:retrotransposon protein, putative, Ty1-copia subclass [Tanacetum cinerariifolium]
MAATAQNTNNMTIRSIPLGEKLTDLQRTLKKYNAFDMMKELKTMFKEQDKQELFEIVKAFHTCKQEDGQSGKIQKNKKKLRGAKGKDKGKTKLSYAPKPKIPSPPKRNNPAKDCICHHCNEVGHWRRNCSSYHAKLKKRKNASMASTSDMHNLYPNVSSMFNVSNKRAKRALESLYMRHCRLGHINKKHIDKLQRDGILQPTHDESLEKCKSCISGKMASKPFPHQVERAKDLLGLIHTDEMIEEDVKNMLEIVPASEFKVEALQVKYPLIDWEIHSEGSRTY